MTHGLVHNEEVTGPCKSGTIVFVVCLLSLFCCILVLSTSYLIPDSAYTALPVRHFSMPAKDVKKKQGTEQSSSCTDSMDCGSCISCEDCASDACSSCDILSSCDCTL